MTLTIRLLAVFLLIGTMFTACTKKAQFLYTEGRSPNMKLFITDKKGQGGKDITPTLTNGYIFDGDASFATQNKHRIVIVSTTQGNNENATATAYFTCNLQGKDVQFIREERVNERIRSY